MKHTPTDKVSSRALGITQRGLEGHDGYSPAGSAQRTLEFLQSLDPVPMTIA